MAVGGFSVVRVLTLAEWEAQPACVHCGGRPGRNPETGIEVRGGHRATCISAPLPQGLDPAWTRAIESLTAEQQAKIKAKAGRLAESNRTPLWRAYDEAINEDAWREVQAIAPDTP